MHGNSRRPCPLAAMWIWLAMLDLKAHVLRGKSFHVVHGPVVIPLVLAVVAITAACFFLNAVFAFAIAGPGPPVIRPAFTRAWSSLTVVLGWGAAVGLCLGVSTVVLVRWGSWWFAISLSIVIAVMMVCYVAAPARLTGMKTTHSTLDKLTLTAVGGATSAVVCTPPYALTRVALLLVASSEGAAHGNTRPDARGLPARPGTLVMFYRHVSISNA